MLSCSELSIFYKTVLDPFSVANSSVNECKNHFHLIGSADCNYEEMFKKLLFDYEIQDQNFISIFIHTYAETERDIHTYRHIENIQTERQTYIYYIYCFVCLCVCLSVCLSVPRNLRGLKSYDHEIWHVGPLSDRKPQCSIRILIFGRKPVLWAQTPFFVFFGLFKD